MDFLWQTASCAGQDWVQPQVTFQALYTRTENTHPEYIQDKIHIDTGDINDLEGPISSSSRMFA